MIVARWPLAVLGEPPQHDAVEGVGLFDVGKMPCVGNLLIARAWDQVSDLLVAGGRCTFVLGPAYDERGHLQRGEFASEVEVEDGRSAAQIACGRGAGNRSMDLLPAPWIARLERIREPTLHGGVGEGRERIRLLHG